MDFEKAMDRLEEIVNLLESGELKLEESLKLFEEGMILGKDCQDKLSKAERKVYILKNGVDPLKEENTKKKKVDNEIKNVLDDNFDLFEGG
ncbi:MAG: exodeoxyribonuclease VII small subunit [Spirochaetota bacterium]|nr:exodeoxyribonuclease VII small subunit [Spirochaetota bacterium]